MRHFIRRIVSKPSDYKVCDKCDSINWYENEECVNCDSSAFSEPTKEYMKDLKSGNSFNTLFEV